MSSNRVFQTVPSMRPGKSTFDLSYAKKMSMDMGKLIPVMCDELVPGDVWQIGNEVMVRMQPLVAPVMHEINAFVHYFFVPYRILQSDWEDFITGGEAGTDTTTLDTWNPASVAAGTLWDYFGFPLVQPPVGFRPLAYPLATYNHIYNDYYRDENLITAVALTQEDILLRSWEKDFFTAALPWQQRGTAPALPISGIIAIDPIDEDITIHNTVDATIRTHHFAVNNNLQGATAPSGAGATRWDNTAMEVDLSGATTFNVADLRLAFQIQKWMERNARSGARYTEFLKAHFGVAPRDDRLDRPEYLGGSKTPIIISEVLQTSSTDGTSPQGNLAGHGITASQNFVTKYRAEEFGLIIGIMSIMPRTAYSQGINRQWLRETRYDFYFPEFANLSEQVIEEAEIYLTTDAGQCATVFGYQGRYDEMRTKHGMIAGDLRETFDYWHLARQFGGRPTLNQTFIECVPRKDIFAAPSEDGFIVHIGNKIRAVRPMPLQSNPGFIDH